MVTNGSFAIRRQVSANSEVAVIGWIGCSGAVETDWEIIGDSWFLMSFRRRAGASPSLCVMWDLLSADIVHENELPRARHGADRHFDDGRNIAPSQCAPQCRAQLFRRGRAFRPGTEAFGEANKIGIA